MSIAKLNSTTVAKKKKTKNLKLLTLLFQNLPPYLKLSNETKCLFAIIKSDGANLNKFSKVIVEKINTIWCDLVLYDSFRKQLFYCSVYWVTGINDLPGTCEMMLFCRENSKIKAC